MKKAALLLSDDELKLLRLLAEHEGLTASDYLRTMLRQLAGSSPNPTQVIRLATLLGGKMNLAQTFEPFAERTKPRKKAK